MPIETTEDQALFLRASRTYLAGPGAPDAAAAARAILGAQAQQMPPALFALSQRTRGRPTAAALAARVHGAGEEERDLVHTWGQRETLHVYDAASDWALFAAVHPELAPAGRRGAMPTAREVAAARKRLLALGRPATRSDLIDALPARLLREAEAKVGAGKPAERLAAGRLFWVLALAGDACLGPKRGAEQSYAARAHWFPALDWPARTPADAGAELARRYLASHAPATVQDVAHFFGARVGDARRWVDALAGELVDVACGGRRGLLALAADERALRAKAPGVESAWPTRLLPLWDCHLMAHADKSWTVPDAAERPEVWRKAALIPGTVLARGRVVATWSHAVKRKELEVAVAPLSGWRKAQHAQPVEREAAALARHLGLGAARVRVG
jgi:hypothetical protein